MKPMNTQIDDAYELLWQVFNRVKEDFSVGGDGVEKFEASTIDTEDEEVRVWCRVSDLKEIINKIDAMMGR